MNRLTPVFLVLLRLAIGWHIFFEGLEKVQDPSWSSAGYLREAAGPLADHFHELGGDPVLDRMTPLPGSSGTPARDRLPPSLAKEWNAYLDQFVRYYGLNEQEEQEARNRLDLRMEQTAQWLIQGKETVNKPSQFGTVPLQRTTPERLEDYRRALETYRKKKDEAGHFGEGANADLAKARSEWSRQRSELLADLGKQTAEMKTALNTVLEEKNKAAVKADAKFKPKDPLVDQPPSRWQTFRSLEWLRWSRLDWSDFVVRWGLLIVGACLLLGLFTRTACIAGALFLVLFYLPMPPWPGLPDNPRTEGHYLFVNKNVIEMLALLMLATTRSGCWIGLDALFALWRGKKEKAETEEVEKAPEPFSPPRYETPAVIEMPAERKEPPVDAGALTPRPDLETAPPTEPKPERGEPSTVIYSPKEE